MQESYLTAAAGEPTVAPAKPRMPRSIPFILMSDLSERLSFFGMRSILPLFLITQFFNPHGLDNLTVEANARSNAYTHAFSTVVYFTPLLGAILADWFWGKYRVILVGSIIYVFGHLALSLFNHSLPGFTAGLVIIGLAAGGIKSCVPANVGDQFDHTNARLMSRGYGWFYFCVNAGPTFSVILIPVILKNYGPAWAFGVPGIMMALAAFIFFAGSKRYVKVPPTGINKANFLTINLYVLTKAFAGNDKKTAWQAAREKFGEAKVGNVKAIWRVMAVFAFIPIFWGLYDMSQSEWVLQATSLDLDLGLFGVKLLPAQVQSVNSIFVLILIPVFNYVIYPMVEKMGIKVTALRKIGTGMFVTALSFVIIAILEGQVRSGLHPSVWWQVLAYLLLTGSEILVVVTGLEYAYTQSPPSMKSTMTAIWFFTYSVGTSFTTYVNVSIASHGLFRGFTGARYFWFFVWVMLGCAIAFAIVSPLIKEKSYLADGHVAA
jgi:proton-dependent oligopeptide transporter, POT family